MADLTHDIPLPPPAGAGEGLASPPASDVLGTAVDSSSSSSSAAAAGAQYAGLPPAHGGAGGPATRARRGSSVGPRAA